MSHFASIGFDVQNDDDLNELLKKVYNAGVAVPSEKGLYVQFRDESGAELWIQVNEDKDLVGLNPFFDGESGFAAGIMHPLEEAEDYLDGSFLCYGNPGDINDEEPGDYPFVFDLPDFYAYPTFEKPSIQNINLCAFAEEMEVFKDEQEFLDLQVTELQMDTESFIPIGLLDEEGEPTDKPKAFAMINGLVISCERKQNKTTNQYFWWLYIQTYGGKIDVLVADKNMLKTPEPGNVVSGIFWLIGRIIGLSKHSR